MFSIGLSIAKTIEDIQRTLRAWFPSLRVGIEDHLVGDREWPPIVIRTSTSASEFPTVVTFEAFPLRREKAQADPITIALPAGFWLVSSSPSTEAAQILASVIELVMIELARRFSEAFSCRAICDGSRYGDSSSPCWCLVWDAGRSYLADDCDTLFADGEGGSVKIVREIHIPAILLDDNGLVTIPSS